jgi:ABC-type glycerol-3-phosphate transport system substrate-binding protein
MKRVISLILAMIMAIALVGCGSKSETSNQQSEGKGKEPIEIKMQIVWAEDSGRGMAIREILDEFEKENPNIKVKLLGGSQEEQKLLTMILSGEAPEVIQVPYRYVQALGGEGAFTDLTENFAANKEFFYEQLWNLAVVDDRLYGYPWMGHTIQLVYNKTLFEEAGITAPPQTWEELYEYAKKLTVDKDGDGKIDQYGIGLVGKQHHDITWLFNMFVNQAGAKIVTEENGQYKVGLNSPEGKKALEFYIKLIRECAPPDSGNKAGGDIMADFRNQVVAMEFQGPWGITDIWKNGNPFEVSAAPVPEGPNGRAADIGPYMLTVPVGVEGEKLEASLKLIEFLGSKKGQEMLMKGEKAEDGNYYPFRVPIRKDMADTEYFKEHPEFLVFIEGLEYPSISTPIKEWVKVEEQVYRSELNKAVIGETSVEEALKNIEKLGNEILSNQ